MAEDNLGPFIEWPPRLTWEELNKRRAESGSPLPPLPPSEKFPYQFRNERKKCTLALDFDTHGAWMFFDDGDLEECTLCFRQKDLDAIDTSKIGDKVTLLTWKWIRLK